MTSWQSKKKQKQKPKTKTKRNKTINTISVTKIFCVENNKLKVSRHTPKLTDGNNEMQQRGFTQNWLDQIIGEDFLPWQGVKGE